MKYPRQAGFTLVELVSVLIIMGILAAVALPRFFNRSNFDARSYYDQAQEMLRYAQKVAVAQNRNVFVRLDGTSISFCFDGNCNNPVPAPAGKNSGSAATLLACANSSTWLCEAPPSGIAYNTTLNSFYFSSLGKPYLLTDTPPNSNFAQVTISVTGDGLTRQFFIDPETGYVHHP